VPVSTVLVIVEVVQSNGLELARAARRIVAAQRKNVTILELTDNPTDDEIAALMPSTSGAISGHQRCVLTRLSMLDSTKRYFLRN
jgi:hypothetical protein